MCLFNSYQYNTHSLYFLLQNHAIFMGRLFHGTTFLMIIQYVLCVDNKHNNKLESSALMTHIVLLILTAGLVTSLLIVQNITWLFY